MLDLLHCLAMAHLPLPREAEAEGALLHVSVVFSYLLTSDSRR